MKNLEQKLNAVLRCLAAQRPEEQEAARAQILAFVTEAPLEVPDMESRIRQLLLELGMPDHLNGHRYLVYALNRIQTEPRLQLSLTHQLYPSIGQHFGATVAQVERSIRHAIEVCWDRGDWQVLSLYFGNTVSAHKGKPTNAEFIARISNELQHQCLAA